MRNLIKNVLGTSAVMAGLAGTAQAGDFNLGGLHFHRETECVEKQVQRTTYHTETRVIPKKHVEWETHTGTRRVPKIVWEETTFEYKTPKCVTTCEEVQVCVPKKTCETVVVPRTRLDVRYDCRTDPIVQGVKKLFTGIGDGFHRLGGEICPTYDPCGPCAPPCNPCYQSPMRMPCGPVMPGVAPHRIMPATPSIIAPGMPTPANNPADPIYSPTYKAP